MSDEPPQRGDVSPVSGVAPPLPHRWQKGVSGNPGGRKSTKGLRAGLKKHGLVPKAFAALKADLEGPAGPERSKAIALVLAYRYGKPTEKVEHTGADGGALVVEIKVLSGGPT